MIDIVYYLLECSQQIDWYSVVSEPSKLWTYVIKPILTVIGYIMIYLAKFGEYVYIVLTFITAFLLGLWMIFGPYVIYVLEVINWCIVVPYIICVYYLKMVGNVLLVPIMFCWRLIKPVLFYPWWMVHYPKHMLLGLSVIIPSIMEYWGYQLYLKYKYIQDEKYNHIEKKRFQIDDVITPYRAYRMYRTNFFALLCAKAFLVFAFFVWLYLFLQLLEVMCVYMFNIYIGHFSMYSFMCYLLLKPLCMVETMVSYIAHHQWFTKFFLWFMKVRPWFRNSIVIPLPFHYPLDSLPFPLWIDKNILVLCMLGYAWVTTAANVSVVLYSICKTWYTLMSVSINRYKDVLDMNAMQLKIRLGLSFILWCTIYYTLVYKSAWEVKFFYLNYLYPFFKLFMPETVHTAGILYLDTKFYSWTFIFAYWGVVFLFGWLTVGVLYYGSLYSKYLLYKFLCSDDGYWLDIVNRDLEKLEKRIAQVELLMEERWDYMCQKVKSEWFALLIVMNKYKILAVTIQFFANAYRYLYKASVVYLKIVRIMEIIVWMPGIIIYYPAKYLIKIIYYISVYIKLLIYRTYRFLHLQNRIANAENSNEPVKHSKYDDM